MDLCLFEHDLGALKPARKRGCCDHGYIGNLNVDIMNVRVFALGGGDVMANVPARWG